MAQPVIDHRGPEFPALTHNLLERMKPLFGTNGEVFIYPASGTGGWECALLNLFAPGDKVLAFETGHFATLWKSVAEKLGLEVVWVEGDWRCGIQPEQVKASLAADKASEIKAVLAVHTETSTGVTSRIPDIREAMDATGHSALLLVDAVSSLACTEFRQEDWGVDVVVSASQKGLMLPPGLSFNAVNARALEIAGSARGKQSYWHWQTMLENNAKGYFPYTPATNLLYGLREALDQIDEEGLSNVLARHRRLAEATRVAVDTWGLENVCQDPAEYCNSTTAIFTPDGSDADLLRSIILEKFNMSLGTGLGKLKGKVFRIGHIGDFNELMLLGTLSGVEMGLQLANVPFNAGGVGAAMDYLVNQAGPAA